ncbi:MAG: VWA domain-containing protein [bacterium]|nr:VWA domain-containing protein [bacterium]
MGLEEAIHPMFPEPQKPDTEKTVVRDEALVKAEEFLRDVAPHLGRLFGMDLRINIGPGWATNMETGEVMADPRFFMERGYTPDMSVYATLHEICAHLREVVTEPKLTDEVIGFVKKGKAQGIFHNIFSDIAGNRLIHAVLPRTMPDVAEQLYKEKLFAEEDYSTFPRHLQFLYKIIRQEMIPDSQTTALPEVDAAIEQLRDYQGKGDLIKYGTSIAKSKRKAMPARERFRVWVDLIYPIYEKLLEQDKQDPVPGSQGQAGDGQSGDKSEAEGSGEQKPQNGSEQPSDQGSAEGDQFESYYEDYRENRHPEPLTEEEHEQVHDHAKKQQDKTDSKPGSVPNKKTERQRKREATEVIDNQVRKETKGHTLAEQRSYNNEIIKCQNAIAEMRDVFKKVIQERIAQKRGLSRRAFDEGAILDPNRLAQTVIDIRSGVEQPEAFRDYEEIRGNVRAIGKTDYVFVFDVSGSMASGGKAEAASASAVIGLEGLAAMQRDIEQAEAENNMELELDIRTAIYTLGERPTCLKPLSTSLGPKERLDTYSILQNPSESNTRDFLTLEEVEKLKAEKDRRQIVVVISDGGSDDPGRARQSVDRLRGQDWLVYGISIGSNEAEELYKPTAKRCDDPEKLPEVIYKFIEATIS